MEEVALFVAGFAVYYIVLILISLAVYVMQSLGFYTIAKRRGIANAWLAWVPVGSMWILGAIADDYQQKVFGKVKNRRGLLLGLSLGSLVVVPLVVVFIVMSAMDPDAALALLVVVILAYLALFVVAIVLTVFQYICLYELYASCDPDNKTLYLLLSIFVAYLSVILVLVCRNKDLGMDPAMAYRRPPQYRAQYQPQYQPQYQLQYQPQYQQPQYQQPQYQQPQYQQPQHQQPQQEQ